MGVLSIEEILAAEAREIGAWETDASENNGQRPLRRDLPTPSTQEQHEARKQLNADARPARTVHTRAIASGDDATRQKFYCSLNKLNRVALCCSGGGIRSATFCLGVIQALAHYDVTRLASPHNQTTNHESQGTAAPVAESDAAKKVRPEIKIDPEKSLLGRFHYLSTVSGGGYIGSWLSAWRARTDFATIINELTGRPQGADVEPPAISWLRAYSNYLTPALGITSADTWAAVAICIRNLILNWLVIIPVVCAALLLLKLIATASVWIAHTAQYPWIFVTAVAAAACLIVAQAFTTHHRPALQKPIASLDGGGAVGVTEQRFLWCDLVWAVASAILVTIFFASHDFASTFFVDKSTCVDPSQITWFGISPKYALPTLTAVAGLFVYAAGWIFGAPPVRDCRDLDLWAASGIVYGALVGFGAYLFALTAPYIADPHNTVSNSISCMPSPDAWRLLLPLILGVPWVLMSQLTAEIIFVGLVSYERDSDPDREWLGRAAGWLAAAAVAWALGALLVFAGEHLVFEHAKDVGDQLNSQINHKIAASGGIIGVVSGLVTAFLGSSAKTPAKSTSDDQTSVLALVYNIALAIAGPVFVAILVVALSVVLDKLLLGKSAVHELQQATDTMAILWIGAPLLFGLFITIVIGWLASRCVNINRFSLHALYRNRLIRAYLGASRLERHPNQFTGFDGEDNIRVHELWSKSPKENKHRLFHVINIALNVVSTKRLAWQERKAESFTVSPLHCGSAYVGFRPSDKYGDGPDKYKKVQCDNDKKETAKTAQAAQRKTNDKTYDTAGEPATGDSTREWGISLGTAMAISGAAVSPNMGYHSSPSITLLLALFNVRLGWWLGNPGKKGRETYQTEGPKWAAKPLFFEAFGQTTDESRYVYLSDGGHFENLGLYEMVRRRSRFIVVIDAGCDPDFAFEDLGNAVRKIYIDLGIRVVFEGLDKLRNRPTKDDGPADKIPYHAIGIIDYRNADCINSPNHADCADCQNGHVLYIKPAYHDTEGAGIRSYATANKKFPHEDTADQWFTESQFESYRSLGMEITNTILGHDVLMPESQKLTLHQILAALR